jgi:hypothetical protein
LDWVENNIREQITNLEKTGIVFKSYHDSNRNYAYQSMQHQYGFVVNWNHMGVYSLENTFLKVEYYRGNRAFKDSQIDPSYNDKITSYYDLKFDKKINGKTGWQIQETDGSFYTKEELSDWIISTLVEGVSNN